MSELENKEVESAEEMEMRTLVIAAEYEVQLYQGIETARPKGVTAKTV